MITILLFVLMIRNTRKEEPEASMFIPCLFAGGLPVAVWLDVCIIALSIRIVNILQ